MKTKIGILGSGIVANTLGNGFLRHGYDVMLGTRNPEKLAHWKNNTRGKTGTFAEAAAYGNILVLAVKGMAAEDALRLAGKSNLTGKTVIDTSNPIAAEPPQNGVLKFFTGINDSLMEQLQKKFPSANLVKAFNSIGSAFMVNPDFGETKPTMFICGNNKEAKAEVKSILDKFGFETEDMGTAEAARAIEPLCMLWCIPGIRESRWRHAFKLLKK